MRVDAGSDVALVVDVPRDAQTEPESALPALNVGNFAGARVILRRGWVTEQGLSLRAGCVRALSEKWAPGAEELVFDRATWLAQRAIPGEIERWDAGMIRTEGVVFDQRISGQARREGKAFALSARHVLGFVGEGRDAVLCTLACAEPAERGIPGGRACEGVVSAARVEAVFIEPPPPSLLFRLILFSAERPQLSFSIATAFLLLIVAIVLARRPRPRP